MHIFEKTGVKDRFELAVRGPGLLGLDVEVEERSSTSPVLAARDTLPRGEY